MTSRGLTFIRALLALYLLLALGDVQAATRAWLDRDRAVMGETVTLNIETDQPGAMPDWSPLAAEFGLSGQTSSRQVRLSNGVRTTTGLFGVALSPKRAGTLEIPALRVGSERTAPLSLTVEAAPAAASNDAVAFVEVEVDDRQPYVQQAVGVVVRLYFATQLASGELVLDTPQGASLQRVGEDVSGQREVRGRRYNIVERRFLLIPERSGRLEIAGARFSGRGVGGVLEEFMGRGNGRLSATAAPLVLEVRSQPAGAAQPWLPLQDLRLRYQQAPRQGRVGEAFVVQVEAVADGVTRAQFPELPVPAMGDDAQVFAEPEQFDESFNGARPQLKVTRRYSIVPGHGGEITVPGLSIPWWSAASGQPRTTELPALRIAVEGGAARVAPPPVAQPGNPSAADVALTVPASSVRPWGWMMATVALAVLWLCTLSVLWQRRGAVPQAARVPAAVPAGDTRENWRQLRQAIDRGGFDEVTRMLCRMAGVDSVDAVLERLEVASQRDAVAAMQQARWAEQGDMAQVRAALRAAFAQPPAWKSPPEVAESSPLPPLYPRR